MFAFLKRLCFGWRRTRPADRSSETSNVEAKRYLNRLREEELSAGASLRRGERLDRAPGQASGSSSAFTPSARQNTVAASRQPRRHQHSEQDRRPAEDFTTSFVVAEATGSALTGYAVGGSMAGALTGEVVSKSLDD